MCVCDRQGLNALARYLSQLVFDFSNVLLRDLESHTLYRTAHDWARGIVPPHGPGEYGWLDKTFFLTLSYHKDYGH